MLSHLGLAASRQSGTRVWPPDFAPKDFGKKSRKVSMIYVTGNSLFKGGAQLDLLIFVSDVKAQRRGVRSSDVMAVLES